MGYNDIGYNNKHVKTPIMDQLAMEGIKLEQNYVQFKSIGMYPYHVGRQESMRSIIKNFYHIFLNHNNLTNYA